MQIDVSLPLAGAIDGRRVAQLAEEGGFGGGWVSEVAHDPFLALGLCAVTTSRLRLGTAVAIALARSPMTVAVTAHDLQRLSRGRLQLGLGSQVQAHITRRFSMGWDRPVARMREFVAALRAIWAAWDSGEPLRFSGDFYTHTLMPPAFVPRSTGYPPPPILLSGVGPRMTELAGAVADGFISHAFSTPRYLRDVTAPALARGAATAPGRERPPEIVAVQMVATGTSEQELAVATQAVREQIAFYASTPSYSPVLECHGYGEAGTELRRLARAGSWGELGAVVDSGLLRAVAVVAEPGRVAAEVRRRHQETASRVSLYLPGGLDESLLAELASGIVSPPSTKELP